MRMTAAHGGARCATCLARNYGGSEGQGRNREQEQHDRDRNDPREVTEQVQAAEEESGCPGNCGSPAAALEGEPQDRDGRNPRRYPDLAESDGEEVRGGGERYRDEHHHTWNTQGRGRAFRNSAAPVFSRTSFATAAVLA